MAFSLYRLSQLSSLSFLRPLCLSTSSLLLFVMFQFKILRFSLLFLPLFSLHIDSLVHLLPDHYPLHSQYFRGLFFHTPHHRGVFGADSIQQGLT
jgi:hypothetical protein